jgi:peptidoglycan hydrolase-like protein with peptidoglycan-binding domain
VVVLSNGSKAGKDDDPVTDALKRGDRGEAVRAMQQLLLKWNPDCLPEYGADGDFGKETEDAVKAFQKAAGLKESGIYDAATEAALKAMKAG